MSEIRKGLNVVSDDVIIKTFIDDISSNQNLNLGSGYDSNNSISYPITLSHLTTSAGEKKAVCVKEGLVGIDTEAPKSKLHIDKTYWGLDDFTSNTKPVSIINKHTCITNQNGYYKIAQLTKPTGHELQAGLNIKGTIVNNDIEFDNGNGVPPFGFNTGNFMQFDITIMMTSANKLVNASEEPNMYMIGTVNGSAYASPTSPGNPGSGADIIVSTNSSTLGETIPKAVILYLPSGVVCNLEITGVGFFQDNNIDSCQLDYDGNRNAAITDCYADFQSPYSLQLSDKDKNDIVFNTPIGLGIRENYPYSTLAVNGNVSIGSGFSAAGATQDKEGSFDLIEHSTSHNNGLIVEGNVGIGVNTPLNKLQVMGNLTLGDGPGTFVGFNTYYDAVNSEWKFVDSEGLIGGTTTTYKKEGWVIRQEQTGSNPDVPNNRLDINRIFNNGSNLQKTPVITIKASQLNLSNARPNGEVNTDDASANFIGINTTTPSCILDISGTDALKIPCGSNEERPEINVKAVEGMIRYNTTEMQFQGYSYDSFNPTSGSWKGLGGVIDVDQNTLIIAETGPTTDEDQLRFFTSARTGDATDAVNDAFQTDRKLQMIIHNTTGGVAIGNTYATDVGNSHANNTPRDYTIDSNSSNYAPPENGLLVEGDVGIGTNNPSCMLDVSGTNALKIPCGNNSQRPTAGGTAVEGMIRYNTEELQFQGYSYDSFNPTTGTWKGLGGVIDVDQDTKIIAEISATNDDDQLQFHTASGYVDNVYYFTVSNMGSFGNKYFVSSSDNQSVSFHNDSGNFTTRYGTPYPVLTLYKGKTYRFDFSHTSNTGHPLRISNALDSENRPTSNFTGHGEYQISTLNSYIDWTPTVNGNYYYGCGSHGGMAANTPTDHNIIVEDEPAISGTIKMVLDNTNGGLVIGNTYSTEVTNSEISGLQLGLKKNKPPKDGLLVEGKVGIGVRQPMEALEINGNILKHGSVRPHGWGGGVTHFDFYSDGGTFGAGANEGHLYFTANRDGEGYFYKSLFIGDSFYNTTLKYRDINDFTTGNKALLALATSSASEDASIVLSTLNSNKKSMLKLTSAATGVTLNTNINSNASGLELSLSDEAYLKTNGTYNLNLGVGNFQHLRINSDGNGIEMFNQYVGTTSQTSIAGVTTCTTLPASPGGCLSINGFINCHALMNRAETLHAATGIVFGTGVTDNASSTSNTVTYTTDQITLLTGGLSRLHVAVDGTVTIHPSLVVNGASTFNNTVTSTHQIEGLSFNATSDARYKENVIELSNALEKITSIRGVNFNFIGESKKHGGIIAQEVEKVIPEAINKENDDKWSANYNTLIGYLIESVKELKKENDELKEELSSKTQVITKLFSDVSTIKDMLKLKI